jgi:hypothetical protein
MTHSKFSRVFVDVPSVAPNVLRTLGSKPTMSGVRPEQREFVFVVVEVEHSASDHGLEGANRLVVGIALQLDGAHDVGDGAGGDPTFDQGKRGAERDRDRRHSPPAR